MLKGFSRTLLPALLAVFALGLARPAAARIISDDILGEESPQWILLELKFGPYQPDIDSEFDGNGPYETMFGNDSFLLSAIQLEFEFFKDWGVASAGAGLGFGFSDGKSLLSDGTQGTESTSLYLLPLNISLTYHLDIFAKRWSVPLVPYVRAGFDYVVWWTTDGLGDVSDWAADADSSVRPGYGGVWGWHVAGGVKLLLDVIAPSMAHTFDIEIGVNNSYLFAEFLYLSADDFGSGDSLNLGDATFLFGLAFDI